MAAEWNDEQITMLVDMWNAGVTAGQIALKMRLTKNAIIGKVSRLRVSTDLITRAFLTKEQFRATCDARRAVDEIHRKRRESAGIVRRNGYSPETYFSPKKARRAAERVETAVPIAFDVTHAKPWTERTFGECAFPVSGAGSEVMSCCARTSGKTYCEGHMSLMFRKPADTGKRFVNGVARFAA